MGFKANFRSYEATQINTTEELFVAAEKQCSEIDIGTTLQVTSRGRRRRNLPERLQSSVVETSVGHRAEISDRESFRVQIVLPVIDCIVSELRRRFSDQACDIMQGIQALNPTAADFLNITKLDKFATLYNSNLEDFHHELHQLKRMLQRHSTNSDADPLRTLLDLICYLEPFGEAFFETFRLAKIAIVIPASSALCERSFFQQ